ncbi:hypothetical protein BH11BAC5_BH11BAC5_47400 [soil metagenome]
MTLPGYLILLEMTESSTEAMLVICNKIGRGYHYCRGDSSGRRELWLIPKGKKSEQEVAVLLQAVPAIRKVSAIALGKLIKPEKLINVRQLITEYGWETSNVSDEQLLMYINAMLQGQSTYYIHFDHSLGSKALDRISIKSMKEHPNYTSMKDSIATKWLEEDGELTLDKIQKIEVTDIQTVVIKFPTGSNNSSNH